MMYCAACTMPLEDESWIALTRGKDRFCTYCVDEHKNVKSCDEIFEGGVQFLMHEKSLAREDAQKYIRRNMNMLDFWKDKKSASLAGEMVSEEELMALFKA